MAGSSPDSTALHTTPSNQALTETNVLTLGSAHQFDQNPAMFLLLSNMVLYYSVSLQRGEKSDGHDSCFDIYWL